MTHTPTIKADIASAYAATAARTGAWVIVLAGVWRILGPDAFALLALVQMTLGLLDHTSLGLGPAVVRLVSTNQSQKRQIARTAYFISFIAAGIALLLTLAYASTFNHLLIVPATMLASSFAVVIWMGIGTLLRVISDSPGAMLQVHKRITLDNLLIAAGDICFGILAISLIVSGAGISAVAIAYTISGLIPFIGRFAFALTSSPGTPEEDRGGGIARKLLSFGLLVILANLADYLYAPVDSILIDRLIDPAAVAAYTPAVHIDSGLLMLVTALATVLFPYSAIAYSTGDRAALKRYYLHGTLASAAILLLAALLVYFCSGLIFNLWFADPMLATQTILPLILCHTIIGGAGAVGRSTLLAVGKAKPFAISVLAAGVINVIASFSFVYWGKLGLVGIVYGTILATVLRCMFWMPWYIMRTLRSAD